MSLHNVVTLMTPANDNAPVLMPLKEVVRATTLSRTAINNKRIAGDFPAEVPLGEKRIAFVRAEVMAWLQARIDARGAKAA